MASPLIWKAFELHQRLFSYMYRNPLHIDLNNKTFVLDKLTSRHIPWVFAHVTIILMNCVFPYIHYHEKYSPPTKPILNMVTIAIYYGICACSLFCLTVSSIQIVDTKFVLGRNQLTTWTERLKTGKRSIRQLKF